MAAFDAPDCLARLRFQIRRPTTDETLSDGQAYQLLTDAQNILYDDVAVRSRNAFLTTPALMVTTDGGQTYGFGTDSNGYPQLPMAKVQLFYRLSDIPDGALIEGWDFLNEGAIVRRPNAGTFPSAPYWRGVPQPADISATSAPTSPVSARLCLIYKAAELYTSLGSLRDGSTYAQLYASQLSRILLRLKTEFGASGWGGLSGLNTAMLSHL